MTERQRGAAEAATIRGAGDPDLRPVAEIHVAAWRAAYRGILPDAVIDTATVADRLAVWARWSRGDGVALRVAEREGRVVGFCRSCPARDLADPPPDFAEVTHLYVSPAATGRGIGHALLADALERARRSGRDGLLLWVLERNDAARRFYAAHGLRPDGARRDEPGSLGEGVFEVRYRVRFAAAAPGGGSDGPPDGR